MLITVLIRGKDRQIYVPVAATALTRSVMAEFIHIRNRVKEKKFVISNSGKKCVLL